MLQRYFGEVLPYLEIAKQQSEETVIEEVIVPKITGLSIASAKSAVKELGLEIELENQNVDAESTIVQEQIPRDGVSVHKGSKIIIHY